MKTPTHWYAPRWYSVLLQPLAVLYRAVALARLQRYTPQRVAVPVICVGNHTVGGTGKTPTVQYLCDVLRRQGHQPHILSRGYGGSYREVVLRVNPQQHSAAQVGDEPLLLAETAPCWVARKRLDGAKAAIDAGATCLVMDDGLQNPTLHKDVSIMVVDGAVAFGNGRLIPAGPCREPLQETLAKTDAILLMGAPTHPEAQALMAQDLPCFQGRLVADDSAMPDRSAFYLAFAGIGRPQKFFDTLHQLDLKLCATVAFADHHPYREAELKTLHKRANANGAGLLTTQKDWVRLPLSWRERVRYLPVNLALEDASRFESWLEGKLRSEAAPQELAE